MPGIEPWSNLSNLWNNWRRQGSAVKGMAVAGRMVRAINYDALGDHC